MARPRVAQRLTQILAVLRREYPEARCSLDYRNPFELLCATILSAQCTDERVNRVTPALFKRFPGPRQLAKASTAEVEKLIQSTGFFRNKARSLIEMSQTLVAEHGGEVPAQLETLTLLRGVGRKTANVILGNAFGVPGLPVDTHVGRLSRRLGFTRETDPVKVEHALMALLPPEDWTQFSHLLIEHGRTYCTARSPRCPECPLLRYCPHGAFGAATPF